MVDELERLVQHDIDVSNMLYGSVRLITICLSPEWELAPGVGRPEIDAVHKRGQHMWIAAGKAWYVLYHKQLGWAMELCLETKPHTRRKSKQLDQPPGLTVHGHAASVRCWQRQRGLFKPKAIDFVEVVYGCEHSERDLRLELSGRCPSEGFEAVLEMIPFWQCH